MTVIAAILLVSKVTKAPEPGPETDTSGCCSAVFLICAVEIPFFSCPCAISTWRTAGAVWLLPRTLV
ncbi:MAG: hypothetical protein ACJ8BW_32620, partial [Ktedonobacteraceae bacterium]